VIDTVAGAGDLVGDDPLATIAVHLEVVADDALGGAVGLAAWRYRVHLGGVDEVDPGGARALNLGEGIGFIVLLAPSHAAQAKGADAQIAAAQLTIFHALLLGVAKHRA